MLRVRDFNGFISAAKVDQQYLLNTESFSIYYEDVQVCRVSSRSATDGLCITLEIFDVKIYSSIVEKVNQIISLYKD